MATVVCVKPLEMEAWREEEKSCFSVFQKLSKKNVKPKSECLGGR